MPGCPCRTLGLSKGCKRVVSKKGRQCAACREHEAEALKAKAEQDSREDSKASSSQGPKASGTRSCHASIPSALPDPLLQAEPALLEEDLTEAALDAIASRLRQQSVAGTPCPDAMVAFDRKWATRPLLHRVCLRRQVLNEPFSTQLTDMSDHFDQLVWAPAKDSLETEVRCVPVESVLTPSLRSAWTDACVISSAHALDLLEQLVVAVVLYTFGGLSLHPSVWWLGRPWPLVRQFLFVQRGFPYGHQVCPEIVGTPSGSPLALNWAQIAWRSMKQLACHGIADPLGYNAGHALSSLVEKYELTFAVASSFLFPCTDWPRDLFPFGVKPLVSFATLRCDRQPWQCGHHQKHWTSHVGVIVPAAAEEELREFAAMWHEGGRPLTELDLAELLQEYWCYIAAQGSPGLAFHVLSTVWTCLRRVDHLANTPIDPHSPQRAVTADCHRVAALWRTGFFKCSELQSVLAALVWQAYRQQTHCEQRGLECKPCDSVAEAFSLFGPGCAEWESFAGHIVSDVERERRGAA